MNGARWREHFEGAARAHWTPARVQELTGGKALRLTPDRAPCLLRAMGVLDADATLHPSRVRKYRQITHLLSFLEPAFVELAEHGPVDLIDAGCGRSALGFLMAWWLEDRGIDGRILGIDRNDAAIVGCRERAARAGLHRLAFATADLDTIDLPTTWSEAFGAPPRLAGVLALHACDTATDTALALALRLDARFFAVAPCCQAELARAWANLDDPPLGPLHTNPHLRRTTAATVTDALRAEWMRNAGYRVRVTEFVEAHHTPKNTLIYGHFTGEVPETDGYAALVAATGGFGIALERLAAPQVDGIV